MKTQGYYWATKNIIKKRYKTVPALYLLQITESIIKSKNRLHHHTDVLKDHTYGICLKKLHIFNIFHTADHF